MFSKRFTFVIIMRNQIKPFSMRADRIIFVILFLLVMLISSVCSVNSYTQQYESKSITVKEFLERPFNFVPSIKNFNASMSPSYKMQRYRMLKPPIDTIYRFYKGKNEIFLQRSKHDESMFAGSISSKKIQMQNGIQIGMYKKDFLCRFDGLMQRESDTIKLKHSDVNYCFTFIFKNDKLVLVKIDNK